VRLACVAQDFVSPLGDALYSFKSKTYVYGTTTVSRRPDKITIKITEKPHFEEFFAMNVT